MTDLQSQIQLMFQEISEREGIPLFDISKDGGCVIPFGEKMMLAVIFRPQIPELDFLTVLGTVPDNKQAEVYAKLLEANFFWDKTNGTTLACNPDTSEILLQHKEPADTLTTERLQYVLEGFLSIAENWKIQFENLITMASGDEDDQTADDELDDKDEQVSSLMISLL